MKKINWEKVLLVLLIGVTLFLRLYQIDQRMTFLGDEGRDAIVVRRLLVEHHPPLLGPPTSIGNIYLGPLYYYMMATAMAIGWLNPASAAMMVALIGTATVGLIYYLTRGWFGKLAALAAAFLYSISPTVITYSHSSWNPNPAPFFGLLAILGFYKSHLSRNYLWLILVGVALAFVVQMHYLSLILIPIFGLLWAVELFGSKTKSYFFLGTVISVAVFLLLMSPLLIFDLRHNFLNYHNIEKFFTDRQTTVNLNFFNSLGRVLPIYKSALIDNYLSYGNVILNIVISFLILAPLLVALRQYSKKRKMEWPYLVLGIWLVGALLGLSTYKQTIYSHYLGFVNPAPYILLGALISQLKKPYDKVAAIVIVVALSLVTIPKNPLFYPPNNQLRRTQEIAKFVIKESVNKDFNFALIAKNNYDAAYQYYLDLYGHSPKSLPDDITDQLFVVCEDPICLPINHPKYEIAAFGWAKIERMEDFYGVKVYKLVHNPSGKPQDE